MFIIGDDKLPWSEHTDAELLSKFQMKTISSLRAQGDRYEQLITELHEIKQEILKRMKTE